MQTRLIRSEVLELRGRDAIAFAQAQFMNDVAALGDDDWHWNGWLTPKGRLVAFFALYRLAGDTLLAWLPAGGAQTLHARLQRFVFRSKVVLDPAPAWQVVGCLDATVAPKEALSLEFSASDDNAPRQLRLLPSPSDDDSSAVDAEAHDDTETASRWRLADLRLGVPYIAAGSTNSEQFIPQWLSLDRLDAYSLKKGCYPGQEIVSRMHYLGQSKRAAFRLRGEGAPPPAMTRILGPDQSGIGDIVWSEPVAAGWEAQAVLGEAQTSANMTLDTGQPATVIS